MVWQVLSTFCLGSTMNKILKTVFSPPKDFLNNFCGTPAGHSREGILEAFHKACSCELVSAWGKAFHHPNAQEREGKVTLFRELLDMVHSVESPRPAKSIPLHLDADVTKGRLEDSAPMQRLSCRRKQVLRGLLTPHQPQKPPLLLWPSFLWGRIPNLSIYSPIPHIPERKWKSSEAHRTAVPSASQSLYEHLATLSALQSKGQPEHDMETSIQPPAIKPNHVHYIWHCK